jgi:peptidoglycan/LPS O-acetylase OafA/YrhL
MIPIIGEKLIFIKFLANMSGLQFLLSYSGYCGAWWYITLAILFYIIYPVIRVLMKKYNHLFMIFSFVLLLSNYIPINLLNIKNILPWIVHFILGVYLSHNNIFESIYIFMKKGERAKYVKFVLLSILLLVLLYNRQFIGQNINGIRIDAFLGLLIILVNYLYLSKIIILKKAMIILGKYSLDIFLVHMFLTHYFTNEFTYSLKFPIIMFVYVLVVSLGISIVLKILKDKLGINKNIKLKR